jgi:tetratricopeptide (TPR) repeat protein
MVDGKIIPTISSKNRIDPEKIRSKLLSPNPKRIKYITDILGALSENKITFASVMQLDRKKMRTLAEQGYIKLKHGRYDEARKVFEILCFVDHKNYFHHLALGGAYHKLRKYLDAAFQYTECLKYDPENTNALVNRGEIFLKHKNYKKAAEDFRSAIIIDQEGQDLFSNRARSLVIAIKRSLAREKGKKNVTLPQSPSRRRKIKPKVLMSPKARKKLLK